MLPKSLFAAITIAAAVAVQAESLAAPISISLEDHQDFVQAPAKVRRLLQSGSCLVMKEIPLGQPGLGYRYFAAVAPCEGGSGAVPSWLLEQRGSRYRVLLDMGAYHFHLSARQYNGLEDVSFAIGNAGHCTTYTYRYDGKTYRKLNSSSCFAQ